MTAEISPKRSLALIKQYRLQPSFARDLSLLGYSTVVSSYEANIASLVGFNYKAFGILKNHDTCCSMADSVALEEKVENLLRDEQRTKIMLAKAFEIYEHSHKKIERLIFAKPSIRTLGDLIGAYWHYCASLGAYNIVYRAISDDSSLGVEFPISSWRISPMSVI